MSEQERLNVNDNRFNYWVDVEDFNKIGQGYLPRKIKANGAGAILQGKEQYYNNVTRFSFTPTYELKEEYKDTIFKNLTHEFILESIFNEDGMHKGFANYINTLRE
jgi:hypothetical protein